MLISTYFSRLYARTFKHLSKILGIKWTLHGAEHLSQNKSLIIVANHQTSLDILGESCYIF